MALITATAGLVQLLDCVGLLGEEPLQDLEAAVAHMGSLENRHVGSRRAPCKGGAFQWVKAPPGQLAPAGSNRSGHGGNEMAEAFG